MPAATQYTVICPDLRGYGDSDKPVESDAITYAKRTMAHDIVTLAAGPPAGRCPSGEPGRDPRGVSHRVSRSMRECRRRMGRVGPRCHAPHDNSGHFMAEEAPQEITAAIGDLVAR